MAINEQTTRRRRRRQTAEEILSDPLLVALANANVAELEAAFEAAREEVRAKLAALTPEQIAERLKTWESAHGR